MLPSLGVRLGGLLGTAVPNFFLQIHPAASSCQTVRWNRETSGLTGCARPQSLN
jgi:hypothetical protein